MKKKIITTANGPSAALECWVAHFSRFAYLAAPVCTATFGLHSQLWKLTDFTGQKCSKANSPHSLSLHGVCVCEEGGSSQHNSVLWLHLISTKQEQTSKTERHWPDRGTAKLAYQRTPHLWRLFFSISYSPRPGGSAREWGGIACFLLTILSAEIILCLTPTGLDLWGQKRTLQKMGILERQAFLSHEEWLLEPRERKDRSKC